MPSRILPLPVSAAALLTLGAGLAASGILAAWLTAVEQREADRVFQRRAEIHFAAVRNGLQNAEEALTAVNSLFATLPEVSRAQFRQFARPLLARYPQVRAFIYQRELRGAKHSADESSEHILSPGFQLLEQHDGKSAAAGNRSAYRVIEYIEPASANEAALGLDTASMAGAERAAEQAAATGQPTATPLFRPVDAAPHERGFAILMPVYRPGPLPQQASARRAALTGFTSAVFDVERLFGAILGRAGSGRATEFAISVYAGTYSNEEQLAFRTGGKSWEPATTWLAHWLLDLRAASISGTIEAAGVPWHVEVATPPDMVRGSYASAWSALVGGALISVLVAAYLQLLAMRNAQLARANAQLTRDIAGRAQAERALRRSQVELRELAAHQERVREDERKRIAREIHDDLGQNLLALRLDVSTVEARSVALDKDLNARVRIVLGQIDTTMKSVRAIINNLRPPVLDLGLQDALEWLAAQFQERNGIVCELKMDRSALDANLDDERATAIFRIVQESLNNASRHAHATRVEIGVRRDASRLFVTITDNGVGSFPGDRRKSRSFGLVGIKERALALGGQFQLDSQPGKGTVVMFSVAAEPAEQTYDYERRAP